MFSRTFRFSAVCPCPLRYKFRRKSYGTVIIIRRYKPSYVRLQAAPCCCAHQQEVGRWLAHQQEVPYIKRHQIAQFRHRQTDHDAKRSFSSRTLTPIASQGMMKWRKYLLRRDLKTDSVVVVCPFVCGVRLQTLSDLGARGYDDPMSRPPQHQPPLSCVA